MFFWVSLRLSHVALQLIVCRFFLWAAHILKLYRLMKKKRISGIRGDEFCWWFVRQVMYNIFNMFLYKSHNQDDDTFVLI